MQHQVSDSLICVCRWLFVGCGCHVKVISLSSKEVVHTLIHHSLPITALAQNPRNHMQVIYAVPSADMHQAIKFGQMAISYFEFGDVCLES